MLIVHPWIKVGGAALLILQLARELTAAGHSVGIATCYVDTSLLESDYKDLRFILPWRWISRLSERSLALISLFGGPALLWLVVLRARDYDVIQPHNFPSLWVAWVASLIRRKPLVWQFNEPTPPPLPGWFTRIDSVLARRVSRICVLDGAAESTVRQLFRRGAVVVHPGTNFEFFSHVDEPAVREAASRYSIEGRRVLLSVGNIDPQKNQVILVEVLDLLREELPDLTLVLVGQGPDQPVISGRAIELGLGDRVVLAGAVTAPELRALYRLAFLVCFPARHQTWGLTPLEALAQRTVSLVSSEAGVSELLESESIGLVAEPSPVPFASQVRLAAAEPERLHQMAERGFQYAATKATWAAFAQGIARCLEQAVADPVPA